MRLKANEAAIVSLRMNNYNELSDNKQVCIVPNPNSQSAAVLGRSFSITKSGLCVSVLLNTLDIPITIQRGRKLGYALPVKTRYEMTENSKQNEVVDCPNHRDKICILRRLKKIKGSSGLVKSLKSETWWCWWCWCQVQCTSSGQPARDRYNKRRTHRGVLKLDKRVSLKYTLHYRK